MECLYGDCTYLIMVGLERILDCRGVGLESSRFHYILMILVAVSHTCSQNKSRYMIGVKMDLEIAFMIPIEMYNLIGPHYIYIYIYIYK